MCEDTCKLLNLRRLPARLTSDQAAPILGMAAHDIPILVSHKLIKALGNPASNAVKHFAATEILKRSQDADWLDKATSALYAYWVKKNHRRKRNAPAYDQVDSIAA